MACAAGDAREPSAQARDDGIRLSEHIEGADGDAIFGHACAMGLEGIVAKRRDRPYRSGRSPDWIKVKNPECTGCDQGDRWMNPKHRYGPSRKASPNVKRSVNVAGRNTSVALEDAFWDALKVMLLLETFPSQNCLDNQNRTPARQQPFIRDPPVRSRLLPAASLMAPKHPTGPPMTLGNMREFSALHG